MIGIITAMKEEADAILKWTSDQNVYEKGNMRFISGKIEYISPKYHHYAEDSGQKAQCKQYF